MSRPIISICIPTFNRSMYLAELLESICRESQPDIEVCISDDASQDNTTVVVDSFRDRLPRLIYLKQPANIGLDSNFQAVVALASGDYVWLMGDDDRLEPGGSKRVLQALGRWPSVVGLTLGVIDYDHTMSKRTGIRLMPPTQLLTGAAAVFRQIPELLGFMSAMVIERKLWNEVSLRTDLSSMQNLYTQVYIMGLALDSQGTWGIVNEPCVGFRTDNDQFKRKVGSFQRLKIDAEAYEQISAQLFKSDPGTQMIMRRRIFESHIMARLINASSSAGEVVRPLEAFAYLFNRYAQFSSFWTRAVPLLLLPRPVVFFLRKVYQTVSPKSGAARARGL